MDVQAALAIVRIVDRHLADVVSGSIIVGYTPGSAPDAVAAYERAFQEAAVEGITFTFASGDIGWATDEVPLSGDGSSWEAELPGYQGKASGGGTSTAFPQPFYQRGVVPASFAGSPAMRTVSDVAALADPDLCLLVGETDYNLDGSLSYKVGNGAARACPHRPSPGSRPSWSRHTVSSASRTRPSTPAPGRPTTPSPTTPPGRRKRWRSRS
jgi:hypothetical protein